MDATKKIEVITRDMRHWLLRFGLKITKKLGMCYG